MTPSLIDDEWISFGLWASSYSTHPENLSKPWFPALRPVTAPVLPNAAQGQPVEQGQPVDQSGQQQQAQPQPAPQESEQDVTPQ